MSAGACLVADVGGTHARFALLASPTASVPAPVDLASHARFACRDHANLENALDAYLATVGRPALRAACISIAGPVDSDVVRMTNLDWSFSTRELQSRYQLQQLNIINDAAAGALATTVLVPGELAQIKAGTARLQACRLNLIPGTGFGIAGALPVDGGWHPIQGEGGHASLAPTGDEEFAVLRQVIRSGGRAVADQVLSGPGMLRLYQALARVRGVAPLELDPVQLTESALSGEDTLCVAALDLYLSLLGSLAGDLALTFNAHGGVYLSGNLLQKLGASRMAKAFNQSFIEKGAMSEKVAEIPVLLVERDFPGLLGAAVWLSTNMRKMAPNNDSHPDGLRQVF